jgi:hypothetical protein
VSRRKLARFQIGDTVIPSPRRRSTLNSYRALVNIGGRYSEVTVEAKTMIEARNMLEALYGRGSIKTSLTKAS